MSPDLIFYGYDLAPNPQKLLHFLAYFNIPYKYVELPVTMPRPILSELGITYRRTPLLSIASDMYVDNALIIDKLSDIARHSLDTNGLTDATNHVEYDGIGQTAFFTGVALLPSDTPWLADEAFLADRKELTGRSFSPDILKAIRPMMISKMTTLVNLVQSRFLDSGSRRFFLGGDKPTTADLHLYWGLNWGLRYHTGSRPEISESTHPTLFTWLDDVTSFLGPRKHETRISPDDAYEILRVPPTHEYAKFVKHVEGNPEGLSVGAKIKVIPEDTGRTGVQRGELISLNYEQVCLRNEGGLVMHFPRLGYEVGAV